MLHIKFQASGLNGSEGEDLLNKLMYFYDSKLGSPGGGHRRPWDLRLNKFGKGPPGSAT